jgi:undecaprenyl-diphosphatase
MQLALPAPFAPWFDRAKREIAPLAALLVVALSANAFLAIADEVSDGDTRSFDRAILYALRAPGDAAEPIGPHWLKIAAADLTALGSVTDLGLIVLLVAGLFLGLRRGREALVLVLASGGGLALSQGLKLLYGRERPPLGLHAVEVVNASFPSGHAMLSAAIYLTLGALIARFVAHKRIKAFAIITAVVLSLLVGISRVYLGVHWPTDVLAGWCVGAAWALAWWLLVYLWERRWPELRAEKRFSPADVDQPSRP